MITPCLLYLLDSVAALDEIGVALDYFPADAKTGALADAAFVPVSSDTGTKEINACIVRRKTADEDDGEQNYATYTHMIWIEYVRTYRGSETQRAFDAALDALLASFERDARLGKTVTHRGPARLTVSEERFFYKWLVHYGRIELTVDI